MDYVSTFLHLGYVPGQQHGASLLHQVLDGLVEAQGTYEETARAIEARDDERLLLLGEQALLSAVAEIAGEQECLVPLSGGLDSRAVLAVMLRAGMRDRITTASYGVPGMYDYELGAMVAKRAAVRHESLDLRDVSVSREGLARASQGPGAWTPLWDRFFNHQLLSRFGAGKSLWSGFFGDAITGDHLPDQPSVDWASAVSRFCNRGRFYRGLQLPAPGFDITRTLPAAPLCEGRISFDDQLDFGVRQSYWIANACNVDSPGARTLFLAPPWVAFMMALPFEQRVHQRFFRRLMGSRFGDLFALPTKKSPARSLLLSRIRSKLVRKGGGLFRSLEGEGSSPRQNYINFDYAMRTRPDYRDLVGEAMNNLGESGLVEWLRPEALYRQHIERDQNLSRALLILTALDVNREFADVPSGNDLTG